MPGVVKRGDYFVTRYITGPQSLLLMLNLQSEPIADPFVTAIDVCPMYGKPENSVVQSAVLAGTDQANAEFGTSWHAFEIKYSYSGYDNKRCSLMSRGAYDIVKELAHRGVEGIAAVPEQPPATQG